MGTCQSTTKKPQERPLIKEEEIKRVSASAVSVQQEQAKEFASDTKTPSSNGTVRSQDVGEVAEELKVGLEIRRLKIEAARARLLQGDNDKGAASTKNIDSSLPPGACQLPTSRMMLMTGEVEGPSLIEKMREDKILAAQRRLQEYEEKSAWSHRKSTIIVGSWTPGDESDNTSSSSGDEWSAEPSTGSHHLDREEEGPESDQLKPLHSTTTSKNNDETPKESTLPYNTSPPGSSASTSSITTMNSMPDTSATTTTSSSTTKDEQQPQEGASSSSSATAKQPINPLSTGQVSPTATTTTIRRLSSGGSLSAAASAALEDEKDSSDRIQEPVVVTPLPAAAAAGQTNAPLPATAVDMDTVSVDSEEARSEHIQEPANVVPAPAAEEDENDTSEQVVQEPVSPVALPTEQTSVSLPSADSAVPVDENDTSDPTITTTPPTVSKAPVSEFVTPPPPEIEDDISVSCDDYNMPMRQEVPVKSPSYSGYRVHWDDPAMATVDKQQQQDNECPAMDSTSYDSDGSYSIVKQEMAKQSPFVNLKRQLEEEKERQAAKEAEEAAAKKAEEERLAAEKEAELQDHDFPLDFSEIEHSDFRRICAKMLKRLNHNPWDEFKKYFDEDVCDYILEHPNCCKVRYDFDNFSGQIFPLSVICTMGASVRTVRLACEAYPEAKDVCDMWIGTPLHFACSYKAKLDVIQYLADNNPDMLEKKNAYGRMPLHMACLFHANISTIKYLIETYPEATSIGDKDSNTPLHLACENGTNSDIIQMLVDADIEMTTSVNKDDATPLHLLCAASSNNIKLVSKVLLKANPKALQYLDYLGQTPLHVLVKNVNCGPKTMLTVAKMLVKKLPEIRDAFDDQGQTAFRIAKRKRLPMDLLKVLESD